MVPTTFEKLVQNRLLSKSVKSGSEFKMAGLLFKLVKDLCFGDELLANYLMIALVANPTVRSEGLVLGHFPLNIKNCK